VGDRGGPEPLGLGGQCLGLDGALGTDAQRVELAAAASMPPVSTVSVSTGRL